MPIRRATSWEDLKLTQIITTKQQFLDKVVERKLLQGDSWVVIHENGTVEGQGPKGGKVSGNWDWEGNYYKRLIVFDDETLPEDFQAVFIADDTVTFTHDKGQGESVSWTIT